MDENGEVLVWKDGEDMVGGIGVLKREEEVEMEDISVNRWHGDEGMGKEMILGVEEVLKRKIVIGNELRQGLFDKCERERK